MASAVLSTIPYEPGAAKRPTSLSTVVQQLVKQKGPFHTITEARLLEDQALSQLKSNNQDATDDDEIEDGASTETQQQTLSRLYRARQQMTEELGQVQQHIVSLIDTISFAIAGRSRVGEASISPFLRQSAPVGSVETKQVELRSKQKQESIQQSIEISNVTKAQAFHLASCNLAAASKRLQNEAQRQAKHWEQMAVLRANGWPVSRLPNNDRALVLHFGCAESAPQYRNKGIAVLQQDEKGDLVLPGQAGERQQKILSVTVHRDNNVTGLYEYRSVQGHNHINIEKDLMRARESLFQEELFNEASREARLIANMGVKTRSHAIEVEISPGLSIQIRYQVDHSRNLSPVQTDYEIASFFGTGLRLMLIAEHRHKYEIRTRNPPQSLSQHARSPAEFAILRPLIAQLRHQVKILPVIEYLRRYQSTMKAVNMAFSFEHLDQSHNLGHLDSLNSLRNPVNSVLELVLPSGKELKLRVETHLAFPFFGSHFLATTYHGISGTRKCSDTGTVEDVMEFLDDVIAQEIAAAIVESSQEGCAWGLESQDPLMLRLISHKDQAKTLEIRCSGTTVLLITYSETRKVWRKYRYANSSGRVLVPNEGWVDTASSLLDLLRLSSSSEDIKH